MSVSPKQAFAIVNEELVKLVELARSKPDDMDAINERMNETACAIGALMLAVRLRHLARKSKTRATPLETA